MVRERADRSTQFIGGALAFLAGYVLVFGSTTLWSVRKLAVLPVEGTTDVAFWRVVGNVFFASHAVGIWVTTGSGGNMVHWQLPVWLYAIPPLVLVTAGFALSWLQRPTDRADGLRAGADAIKGYSVPALLGLLAFQWSFWNLDGVERVLVTSGGPDLITGIVLAGVLYPIVFGSLGGFIATAVRDTDQETDLISTDYDPVPTSS